MQTRPTNGSISTPVPEENDLAIPATKNSDDDAYDSNAHDASLAALDDECQPPHAAAPPSHAYDLNAHDDSPADFDDEFKPPHAAAPPHGDEKLSETAGTDVGSGEKYEVSVVRYARYDDAQPGYAPEVVASIHYASRSAMWRFCTDFVAILARPSSFWKGQDAHPATLLQLHIPHLAILVVLRMAAFLVGGSLRPDYAFSVLIVQTLVQGFLIFLLVWSMSIAVAAAMTVSGAGFHLDRALRFVAYGITPLLFVGIVGVIPLPYLTQICDLLAMPWAFVTMGCAVLPYLHAKEKHAPILSALFCGMLLCLWGALPMLIPYLLSLKWFS